VFACSAHNLHINVKHSDGFTEKLIDYHVLPDISTMNSGGDSKFCSKAIPCVSSCHITNKDNVAICVSHVQDENASTKADVMLSVDKTDNNLSGTIEIQLASNDYVPSSVNGDLKIEEVNLKLDQKMFDCDVTNLSKSHSSLERNVEGDTATGKDSLEKTHSNHNKKGVNSCIQPSDVEKTVKCETNEVQRSSGSLNSRTSSLHQHHHHHGHHHRHHEHRHERIKESDPKHQHRKSDEVVLSEGQHNQRSTGSCNINQQVKENEHVVPPIKIRVEHSKSTDQVDKATYVLNNPGSKSSKEASLFAAGIPKAETRSTDEKDPKNNVKPSNVAKHSSNTSPVVVTEAKAESLLNELSPGSVKRKLSFDESLRVGSVISPKAEQGTNQTNGSQSLNHLPVSSCRKSSDIECSPVNKKPKLDVDNTLKFAKNGGVTNASGSHKTAEKNCKTKSSGFISCNNSVGNEEKSKTKSCIKENETSVSKPYLGEEKSKTKTLKCEFLAKGNEASPYKHVHNEERNKTKTPIKGSESSSKLEHEEKIKAKTHRYESLVRGNEEKNTTQSLKKGNVASPSRRDHEERSKSKMLRCESLVKGTEASPSKPDLCEDKTKTLKRESLAKGNEVSPSKPDHVVEKSKPKALKCESLVKGSETSSNKPDGGKGSSICVEQSKDRNLCFDNKRKHSEKTHGHSIAKESCNAEAHKLSCKDMRAPHSTPDKLIGLRASNLSDLDYTLRRNQGRNLSKFGNLIHIERYPNGDATVVHAYDQELNTLGSSERSAFVHEFFKIVFDEELPGIPRHVMGIVHGAAKYLPDILEYFATKCPDMIVKKSVLGKPSDIETTTIGSYHTQVQSSYSAGTLRTGGLHNFSIVGTKAEESGDISQSFLTCLSRMTSLKK